MVMVVMMEVKPQTQRIQMIEPTAQTTLLNKKCPRMIEPHRLQRQRLQIIKELHRQRLQMIEPQKTLPQMDQAAKDDAPNRWNRKRHRPKQMEPQKTTPPMD
jgi:hypothetical protein